jgi:D-glycero-D-manno-heptose 1,7-bisphosphate phosphatase
MITRPALFLDRDGVINVDHGYVHQAERVVFLDGIFDLVRMANASGYCVVVVTNQAGIGRGYYTQADFFALSDWMQHRFTQEGAVLDAIYHCPHHPIHGLGPFKRVCTCRKPQPGMLLQAIDDLAICAQDSIMIGDKVSDLQAAQRAGVSHRFLLHQTYSPLPALELSADALTIHQLLSPSLTRFFRDGASQFAQR